MPKKRSRILGKAWELISLSFTPVAKVRKPISKKLLLFKKAKRFRLLRHYNYAFIGEYEFSPSGSPLFLHARAPPKKRTRLLGLLCGRAATADSITDAVMEEEVEILSPAADGVRWELQEPSDSSGEDDSVDRKAEKFIERFYEEMRIQRQESLMQYKEMLHRSCS